MHLSVCVTTMNRTPELDDCLRALWNSDVKPYRVIVSDNSVDPRVQQKNRQVVDRYPNTIYLEGTHAGVPSNRNNAFSGVPAETNLVAFLADDICVKPDFIARAIDRYAQMSVRQRNCTILSGECISEKAPNGCGPLGLTFRGYFGKARKSCEVVSQYAAIYPYSFFCKEKWDENIYLGQEDAEISLRALSLGYHILYCPDMVTVDMCPSSSVGEILYADKNDPRLTNYEVYLEASRLYIGIKRYKYLFPNLFKLVAFVSVYFVHMTLHLFKRKSLSMWPDIIRLSNVQNLRWKRVKVIRNYFVRRLA